MRYFLESTQEFKNFLSRKRRENRVCNILYLIHTKGISEDYLSHNRANYLSVAVADRKKVAFAPEDKMGLSNNWNYKTRRMIKPGRILGKILSAEVIQCLNITQQDIEEFNNLYIARFVGGEINVVNGQDICKWYLEDNYNGGSASLWDSCMRYESCQGFIGFYANSPDVCSMLIMKDPQNNLLEARALLWKTIEGYTIMDRVYYNQEYHVSTFIDYAKKHGYGYKKRQSYSCNEWYLPNKDGVYELKSGPDLSVQMNDYDEDCYPYMDSLYHYNLRSNILSVNNDEDFDTVMLRDTGGQYEEDNNGYTCYVTGERMHEDDARYCTWHDDYIHYDIAAFIENRNEYMHEERAMWSDYYDVYMHPDDAYYCEFTESYYYRDDVVILKDGTYCYKGEAIEFENYWYHNSDTVQAYNDEWIPKDEAVLVTRGDDDVFAHADDVNIIFCEEDGTYYLND